MASTLSWLDFSEADQRRSREMVQLFMQRESRDELGIGIIRDAFSNAMFPGVSVIQTRARYYVFIPWLFQRGTELGRRGEKLLAWTARNERSLIDVIRKGGDEDGLIGKEAGKNLKTLPSTIYWNGLLTYGILRWPGGKEQLAHAVARPASIEDALTEQVDRADTPWDLHLPPRPSGFPNLEELDFQLTDDEASWLRDRVMAGSRGSLLEWMVAHRVTPGASGGPWDEPWADAPPPAIQRVISHARMFSLVMHGAALRYNEMLADRCTQLCLPQAASRPSFAQKLTDWEAEMNAQQALLDAWDLDDFWALVGSVSTGRISAARRFVNDWVALVRHTPAGVHGTSAYERLFQREAEQKRGQARLTNDRLLRQWGGSSGADRLAYRWGQVRRFLLDLNADGS